MKISKRLKLILIVLLTVTIVLSGCKSQSNQQKTLPESTLVQPSKTILKPTVLPTLTPIPTPVMTPEQEYAKKMKVYLPVIKDFQKNIFETWIKLMDVSISDNKEIKFSFFYDMVFQFIASGADPEFLFEDVDSESAEYAGSFTEMADLFGDASKSVADKYYELFYEFNKIVPPASAEFVHNEVYDCISYYIDYFDMNTDLFLNNIAPSKSTLENLDQNVCTRFETKIKNLSEYVEQNLPE